MSLLGLLFNFIYSFFTKSAPEISRWLGLGGSVCGMLTQFFVLSGIASLAEKMVDGKVKAMVEKARVVVFAVSVASTVASLITDYLPEAVFLEYVGHALSIASALYYLTVLAKGKKMLAS